MIRFAMLLICLTWLSWARTCEAEIGDVLLSTDHPQYPGEGAFQTPADCVNWATGQATNDQQRALAIFEWLLTHQWHLHSPQEWCQVGRRPGADPNDPEMIVYDANRGRFSYGYGLCGTVHAWNEPYWQAAGFQARRRAFPGHTNSEVFVDGRWRMFDTDMAGIVLARDGSVAGYDEITTDLSLLDRDQGNWPRYPFAWPSDFEVMKAGWKKVASGGHWYKLYHGGYAAQPGVVHLRSGESLTRYAHPDAFGGPEKRRFWHQQKDGPARTWTFAGNGRPFHRGQQSNSRGQASYGNAVFEYEPDLSGDRYREGAVEQSENLRSTEAGLQSEDSKPAQIIFHHFSPYVICGDPRDDQDPMQHEATDGFIISGRVAGSLRLAVSPDQGQSWHELGRQNGSFQIDATEQVKGRYGWWLKVSLNADSDSTTTTLQSIRMVTTGQMCQSIYPRLKSNGCRVVYRSRSRAVVPLLPHLVDETSTVERYEEKSLRSANLEFVGRRADQRFAYRVAGPKPAQLVFRLPVSTPLVGLSAAARFALRAPTPEGADYRLDYSLDNGQNWLPLGRATPPTDNEYSSGWVYGAADFESPTRSAALLRVTLNGGGYQTGLLAAEMYGLRPTNNDSAARVTYSWFDGEDRRAQTFSIEPGQKEFSTTIPTGKDVRDNFVRVSVDSAAVRVTE